MERSIRENGRKVSIMDREYLQHLKEQIIRGIGRIVSFKALALLSGLMDRCIVVSGTIIVKTVTVHFMDRVEFRMMVSGRTANTMGKGHYLPLQEKIILVYL
jgi:hypothetical protein